MPNIDLSAQPSWKSKDPNIMLAVEEDMIGVRRVVVAWIGRLRSRAESYTPVADAHQGGPLMLSQAQTRHLHAELGKQIARWDTEPRDMVAEADEFLSEAGYTGRKRASTGYEIETNGEAVHVYHATTGGRVNDEDTEHLLRYATALKKAGYTGPGDSAEPVVHAPDGQAAHIVAVPPAAESF
ncbi:hypothetical protein [Streptomyces sp. NPDC088727]|uniref:hypothetical protein n=1 Tax=Streptomyces sp. NPDC088727 TaxID=3365875 RepID=UPI0037F1C215